MKNFNRVFVFILTFILNNALFSQSYCDVPFSFMAPSNPESIDTFTVYVDTVTNYYGDEFKVKLKFAVPVNDNLPFVKRPLIIALHGGGFISDSLGAPLSTNSYLAMADQMRTTVATVGYIGASLDYRTGFGLLEEIALASNISAPGSSNCDYLTPHVISNLAGAVYRATVDCRSAIDYIFRNPDQFPLVDTSQIYLFGGSAGAITALHAAFSETDEFYPESDSLLEPLAPKHKLAGVVSFAGALAGNSNGIPLNHMDADESVLLFLGHGTADQVVLPGIGPICNCSNIPGGYHMDGSIAIADQACLLGFPHELFLIEGGGHGLDDSAPISTLIGIETFTFLKDRGICGNVAPSVHKRYTSEGALISSEPCSTAGVEVSELQSSFSIFPNPAMNSLHLTGVSSGIITITDVSGRIVLKEAFQPSIDLSYLGTGLYYITIVSNNKIGRKAFIKSN